MAIDPVLRDRWLREFRLNGFVILRGFLPVSFVESVFFRVMDETADAHAPDQPYRTAKAGTA